MDKNFLKKRKRKMIVKKCDYFNMYVHMYDTYIYDILIIRVTYTTITMSEDVVISKEYPRRVYIQFEKCTV